MRRWTSRALNRPRLRAHCASTPFRQRRGRSSLGSSCRSCALHPQVHIDIVTEGRLVDIVAGGFDLGVRSADLVPADMIALPLGVLRRNVVVGTPSYLKAHGTPLTPQDLTEHTCLRVRLPNGAIHRWPFEKDGQSVHIDVEGAITLDEASLARTAVLASVGLALAMESDVRDDIEAGRLVRVLEDWTPILSPLSLYYPSRRNPTAAFKAFVDFARRQSGASITLTPSIITDIRPL